jgi:hypothetical protein
MVSSGVFLLVRRSAKDALLILMIGQGICSAFQAFRFI